jgi:hypothetical protein
MTPMPPYEPPKERFTPPREVLGTPIGGKATKKKASSKRSGKQLKLVVKEEPPELDLTQPPPPASPTEDPLYLAGSPPQSLPTFPSRVSPSLPLSSSPWSNDEVPVMIGYVGTDTSDTSFGQGARDDDIVFPAGEWSDSDDGAGDFNQSGEFTGKFTTIRVPTKVDPPTSVTKDRQDAWGRPVSPFPYPNRRNSRWSSPLEPVSSPSQAAVVNELPGLDDDNLDQMNIDDPTSPPPLADDHPAPKDPNSSLQAVHPTPGNVLPSQQSAETPAPSRLIPSVVPSMFNFMEITPLLELQTQETPAVEGDLDNNSRSQALAALPAPAEDPVPELTKQKSVAEEEEEEQLVDRELSQGLFNEVSMYRLPLPETPAAAYEEPLDTHAAVFDESEESDGDEPLDLGVIKISSEDPMAAARAAAILKLVRLFFLLL